jgi:hypothetical protein
MKPALHAPPPPRGLRWTHDEKRQIPGPGTTRRAFLSRRRQLARCAPSAPWAARRRLSSAPKAPTSRRRRQPLHRLLRLLGPMILGHAFPPVVEAIERRGRNSPASAPPRRRGRPRRAVRGLLPVHRKAALRQLRHRGHHVGHPPGPRRHRPQVHRQVRRLLPRPLRRPAGQGRLRRGHLRHPRLGRRSRGDRPAHPGPALQRSCRGRSRLRRAPRRRSPAVIVEPVVGNAGCIPPRPGYLEAVCARSPGSTARCSSSTRS